ncbi:glycosyltransferase [Methylorubrum populi]|uniref:UDP:flavonoid glycosyltransferase YjiC (YdhE family) n=3 Tax=Methylobacterium TaxID=407 RepID=A0AAJ1TMF7_9HYPH|nr:MULTISPECIES: glycosyltransferase [Methylobacterium]MBY0256391.1 glycosyltransferase [Methylobacterium sp.]MCB4802767.1 glycosyltransferase [Methylobacterium brachiatum]MDQ0543401.1 UDP:flavonoid glycosyltransferase YjiC (YdhE family) [Methylobacterium brachiatum]
MKVLLAATPLTGHVNPMLAVGRLLADRGDSVTFVTDPAFAPQVHAAGFHFIPCPDHGAASYLEPHLPPGPERWSNEFARRFIDPMPGQAALLRELIEDEAPDMIVAGSMFLGVLPLLQSSRPRPRIVVLNVSVLFLDRADGAPVGLGLPPARDENERARYLTLGAAIDLGFVGPVRAHADGRLAALGLPPLPASLTQSIVQLPDVFLQQGVPGFEFECRAPPRNLRFIGLLPLGRSLAPRPSWWDELDGDRAVVLVTQGTLANGDLTQLVVPTLAALADRDDLLVVATTGGKSVDALGTKLPPNARVASFLPFDAIFPKVDVFVTNGGYGSVLQSLAAGVPIVAAGKTEDKAEVAARVGWSGVGIDLGTSTPTGAVLGGAIDRVLSEPGFRRRAQAMAADFEELDAGREILGAIDELFHRDKAASPASLPQKTSEPRPRSSVHTFGAS